MQRLKQEVKPLLQNALESLSLSIELFNRPSEVARHNSVLIFLHHSFEMLLKSVILQRVGNIHDNAGKYTHTFQKCLSVCTDALCILSADEKATLAILDAQRDQATHFYIVISEDLLYVHVQSGVTLFEKILKSVYGIALADKLPNRVLPVCAHPPADMMLLLDQELSQVDSLLLSGRRQGVKAKARLRSVMAFIAGSREIEERVSEKELTKAIGKRRKGDHWELIFPEVAQLKLDTEGTGIPISMKIVKEAPIAVKIAQPGEPIVGTLLKQEINLWDTFNLSRNDIAEKLGSTGPKIHALIYEIDLQSDPKCYREWSKKNTVLKGYSKAALEKLRTAITTVDMDEIWRKHKHRFGAATRNQT